MERGITVPVGQGFAGRIASERRPVILADVDHAEVVSPVLREKGIRSLLGVPLHVEGAVIGVLHVGMLVRREFSEDDARLLQLVADRVALAVDRAALYEREQAANRAKDEFLAMLGHELRNPLSSIMTAAQVMQRAPAGDPALRRAAEVTDRQARQLARLLADLLDVSRIPLGKIELQREAVDVGAVVREAIESVRTMAENKGHRLAVTLPDDALWVFGDRARLVQIVTNLIDNAIKYTPHGGVLSLQAERQEDDVVVRVRDTGRGISKELPPTPRRGSTALPAVPYASSSSTTTLMAARCYGRCSNWRATTSRRQEEEKRASPRRSRCGRTS